MQQKGAHKIWLDSLGFGAIDNNDEFPGGPEYFVSSLHKMLP